MAKTHLQRMAMSDDEDDDDSRDSSHFAVDTGETDSQPLDKSCLSVSIESYRDSQRPMRHMEQVMTSTLVSGLSKQQRQRLDRECNRRRSAMCPLSLDSTMLGDLTRFELFALIDRLRGNRVIEFYIFYCSSALPV